MGHEKDERLMSLLDDFIEGSAGKDNPVCNDILNLPADYVEAYVKNLPDSPETQAESAIRSKTEILLDAFIKSSAQGTVSRRKANVVPVETDIDVIQDVSEQEDVEDAFYTETLARIYLKQHRYDKALEIIRSLYLNFPNKSIYFADQIRYLEKLVRINQKTE